MPKEILKRLNAIQAELQSMLDNANEDDFANYFYYTDFRDGLQGAIKKIKSVTIQY